MSSIPGFGADLLLWSEAAGGGGGAPEIVQYASVDVGNTETRNITFGANVTAGNAVLIGFQAANSFTLTDLDLHDGTNYDAISQTALADHGLGGNDLVRWYLIANVASGRNQVRSICNGWASGLSVAYEISGLGSTPQLDDDGSGSLSAGSSPAVPIVPTVAGTIAAAALLTSGTLNTVTDGVVGGSGGYGYQKQGAREVSTSGSQSLVFNFSGSVTPTYGFVVISAT